jgi:starch phosphorylase
VGRYLPQVGWALVDGVEHGDDLTWDAREAEQLYHLLEEELIRKRFPNPRRRKPRTGKES